MDRANINLQQMVQKTWSIIVSSESHTFQHELANLFVATSARIKRVQNVLQIQRLLTARNRLQFFFQSEQLRSFGVSQFQKNSVCKHKVNRKTTRKKVLRKINLIICTFLKLYFYIYLISCFKFPKFLHCPLYYIQQFLAESQLGNRVSLKP